ncbi:hypothetical protein C0Q70_20211 [Pomacea canaliculata]|uniref:Uncharacterized protein n=1 Tax=Pomacea canaliculata TaxID=400727 RepID=A0A2T7NEY0_POMCA|nr:hypothetical protein C0Q70_20211 [Pomacea canaliculata]
MESQQAAGQMMLFKASLSSISSEGNNTSSSSMSCEGNNTRKRKQTEVFGDQSYSGSSDGSSDSEPNRGVQQNVSRKYQPPVNRHQIRLKRHKSRKKCIGTNTYISTPVTVLPTSQGPPSAIVTSMGIFVPIHLASPAKLNSVFAEANISCSRGSKQQPCVTTAQLLNLGAVHSEVSDKATESEAPAGTQNNGVDGNRDRVTDPVESIGASAGVSTSSYHTVSGMLQDTCNSDSGYDLGQQSVRWQDICNNSMDRQVSCVSDEDTYIHGQQSNVHSPLASSTEQNCYNSSCHADSVVRHATAVTLPGSVRDGGENTTEVCMRSGRVKQVMDHSTERQEEVIQSSTVTSGWDSDEDTVSAGNESLEQGGSVDCCPSGSGGSPGSGGFVGGLEDEPSIMEPDSTSSSVDVHLQSCEKEQAECIMDKELQGGPATGKGVNLGPAVTVTSDIVQMAFDSICCSSSKQFLSCCQEKSFDSSLAKEWHKNLLGPAITSIFAITSQEVRKSTEQGNGASRTPVDIEDNPPDNTGTLEEVEQTSTNCADSPLSSDINKQWRRDNTTEIVPLDSSTSDPRSITKRPEDEVSGPSSDVYVSSSGLCTQRPPVTPHVSQPLLSNVCNLEVKDMFRQQKFPEKSRAKEEDPVRDSNKNSLHQGKHPKASVVETSCDSSEDSLQMQTSKAHEEGDACMDHPDARTDHGDCMDGNLVGENIGMEIQSQSDTADWPQSEHLTQGVAPECRTVAAESLSDQLHMQLLNERSPSKHRTSAASGHSISGTEAVSCVITSSTLGYAHRHSASSFAISSTLPVLSSSSVFQATPSSSLPAVSSGPHAQQTANQIKSPKGLCAIAPKPGAYIMKCPQLNPTSSATRGRTRGKEVSPKKRQLQRQVRAILPRGYTYEMKMTSPTKVAAKSLKRKATLICQRTSPAKPILPKTTSMTQMDTKGSPPCWQKAKGKSSCKREEVTKVGLVGRVAGEDRSHEESDGTASDVEEGAVLSQEDSQNEDDADGGDETYVSQLMAASTTIGFDPRKRLRLDKDSSSQGTMSKAEMRKEQKLAILAPDIMETDPKRDVRDTAFAQAYLNKLKVNLQNDPHTYSKLMQLLVQFEKDNGSPVQV